VRLSGLTINCDKSDGTPLHERLHLCFDVDLSFGLFKVSITRCQHLQIVVLSILSSKRFSEQDCKLASLMGTNISMKLAWGLVTQLDTRNLYQIPK